MVAAAAGNGSHLSDDIKQMLSFDEPSAASQLLAASITMKPAHRRLHYVICHICPSVCPSAYPVIATILTTESFRKFKIGDNVLI